MKNILLLLAPATTVAAQGPRGHFTYIGPLAELVAPGVKIAPVTKGLAFDITITPPATVAAGPFTLPIPGADKPLTLSFAQPVFAGGHLEAQASLPNGTSSALEGVRLDIVSVVETYTVDSAGKTLTKTRSQNASLASPLHFGDIAPGEDNGAIPVDVG